VKLDLPLVYHLYIVKPSHPTLFPYVNLPHRAPYNPSSPVPPFPMYLFSVLLSVSAFPTRLSSSLLYIERSRALMSCTLSKTIWRFASPSPSLGAVRLFITSPDFTSPPPPFEKVFYKDNNMIIDFPPRLRFEHEAWSPGPMIRLT